MALLKPRQRKTPSEAGADTDTIYVRFAPETIQWLEVDAQARGFKTKQALLRHLVNQYQQARQAGQTDMTL
jgi:hypothetical protein